MHYRAEIDGLRAIAVVPVILFHAGLPQFGGGFVGVDVFFVISGYLITGIILDDLTKDQFSIIGFYERRARRILPALYFMLLISTLCAWLILLPQDMQNYSQSLASVAVFSSNILFWRTSGYFDIAAELKPLLHTWSLAVEEQYYVIFPIFLVLIQYLRQKLIILILTVIAIVSLSIAQWGSTAKPEAAFYLLPTRGWELLIGALIAFRHADRGDPPGYARVGGFGGWVGLSLIAYAVVFYTKDTPYPSVYTLAPTLGTALVILDANQHNRVGRLLGSRFPVAVGLVSYSAYLWHQPLLAFARELVPVNFDQFGGLVFAYCLGLISFLSWRYVEKPFRSGRLFDRSAIFGMSALGTALLFGFGLAGHYSAGFEALWFNRQDGETKRLYQLIRDEKEFNDKQAFDDDRSQDDGECRFNVRNITESISVRLQSCREKFGKGVAVLGDSHAIDLYGVILTASADHKFLVGFTKGGCRPHTPMTGCHYDEFLQFVEKHSVFSSVVYEQAGYYLLRTKSGLVDKLMFSEVPISGEIEGMYTNELFADRVLAYLYKLNQYVPVVWFGPRIEPHIKVRDALRSGCQFAYSLRRGQEEVFRRLDQSLEQKTNEVKGLRYVSQIAMMNFDPATDFMSCTTVYWADGDHFSRSGETHFGNRLNISVLFGEVPN